MNHHKHVVVFAGGGPICIRHCMLIPYRVKYLCLKWPPHARTYTSKGRPTLFLICRDLAYTAAVLVDRPTCITETRLGPNSAGSICCEFVVQVFGGFHNRSN